MGSDAARRRRRRPYTPASATAALVCLLIAGCATNRYQPPKPSDTVRGMASWYGKDFHGKRTANGEIYDMYGISAAHKELPLGTVVDVTHLDNGRKVRVRINDRGPFIRGRILDLSYGAAQKLNMVGEGVAPVEIRIVSIGGGTAGPMSTLRFTVQAGAFREKTNAVAILRQIEGDHPEARLVTADGWHRVRVGSFRYRKDAEEVKRQLARAGVDARVVGLR